MPDVLLMTVYQCPPFPFVASSRATQIPVAVGGSVQRNAESCAGDLLTSGTPSQSLVGAQSIRRYSTKSSYGVPAVVASVTLRCQQLWALQLMQRAHLMRNLRQSLVAADTAGSVAVKEDACSFVRSTTE